MIISFIYQFIWTNKIVYCRNIGLSCEVDDTRLSPFYHDHDRAAMIGNIGKEWSAQCNLGADSIKIYHLTSIGNPIVEIRRSYDRLISTMGFPILVRWHLYIESGPRALRQMWCFWISQVPGVADTDTFISQQWASHQIRKIAGCAWAGKARNFFPCRLLQMKPLVSDPGMHYGTCVTHVSWCMSGSLTRSGGETFVASAAHAHRQFYVSGKRPMLWGK